MQLYGVLVLMVTLSTACGLRCYTCAATKAESCTNWVTCPPGSDRCVTIPVNGLVTRSCFVSASCTKPADCCKGDLCNGAIPTGSSVLLLLVSSAIVTVFL